MKSITDKTGQSWDVEITFRTLSDVKDRAGVCLLDLNEEDRAAKRAEADGKRLNGNHELMINVLYVLCAAQATARGIDDQQFGGLWDWGSLGEAYLAVDEEFTLFCLPPSKKDRGRKALKDRAEAMDSALDKALRKVERAANAGPSSDASTSATSSPALSE